MAVERTAAHVGGVLDADEAAVGEVRLAALGFANRSLDVRWGHDAARSVEQSDRATGDASVAAPFVEVDVGFRVGDQLVPRLRLRLDRQSIRHRSGGHEKSRFLSQQSRNSILQLDDGRVIAQHIVADHSLRHHFTHRRGRLSHGVGAQVDTLTRIVTHSAPCIPLPIKSTTVRTGAKKSPQSPRYPVLESLVKLRIERNFVDCYAVVPEAAS